MSAIRKQETTRAGQDSARTSPIGSLDATTASGSAMATHIACRSKMEYELP